MKKSAETQNEETSSFIHENKISIASLEVSEQNSKDRVKDQVLNHYLTFYSSKEMKKNNINYFKYAFLGLATFVLAFGVMFLINPLGNNNDTAKENNTAATDYKAAITFVEGDAEVMLEDGRWADIGDIDILNEGDSFRVVGEGKAILTIDDGSAVRLASNTTVNLKSLDSNEIIIVNNEGVIYTRMDKSERVFSVETNEAVYTSLGTAYKTVETEIEKGVYVYESKVEASYQGEKVLVNEGEKFLLGNETSVAKITETEVADEFSNWNKEQDKNEFGGEAAVYGLIEQEKLQLQEQQDAEAQLKLQEQNKIQIQNQNNVQEQTKQQNQAQTQTQTDSISLGGHADPNAGGIYLNWVNSGVDASGGYKVVFSKDSSNPTFGVDSAIYISDPNSTGTFIQKANGVTYYFRVCRYTGNGCDTYSNTMTITAPAPVKQEPVSSVNSISVSGSGSSVTWSVDGYSAKGYKVVWSKTAGPTYPNRSTDKYIYLSDPSSSSTTLNPFDGAGTYYVRVCEYTGNGCNTYSNEITVNL